MPKPNFDTAPNPTKVNLPPPKATVKHSSRLSEPPCSRPLTSRARQPCSWPPCTIDPDFYRFLRSRRLTGVKIARYQVVWESKCPRGVEMSTRSPRRRHVTPQSMLLDFRETPVSFPRRTRKRMKTQKGPFVSNADKVGSFANGREGGTEGKIGNYLSGNEISRLVLEKYRSLGKRGKPQDCHWTVLAGFVRSFASPAVPGVPVSVQNHKSEVIALATGTKCVGRKYINKNGETINDSHAEVLARRALVRYLLTDLLNGNKANLYKLLS
ncbi:hypothetical protein AAMO2058_000865500 [Amorphochlora amoebiformis]